MSAKLKSLELVGFKTFAKKTKFEFSENITSVVGPNGSGKSNISDALRWVLGEQSFTSLRGKKTEDMIFSGTDGRGKASMASATVVFDNSDGWLPIEFSEVSITRKAYRDGNNQYLINNRRVRLADVREMLAKSGLSERTYTVVSQGLVDKALTLKAEERRRLFEEAAGIGLYRSRKEQSLRRLDKTKRNLERVQDILAELSPRIKSLSRQAERAIQHEQIREDLKSVLRDWYGFHWHEGQKNFRQARMIGKEFEQKLLHIRTDYQKFSNQLNENREKISGHRNRLTAWHRELAKIHTIREETSKNLAVSDERKRSFLTQITQYSSEKIELQKQVDLEKDRYTLAQTDARKLATDSFEAKNKSIAAKESLQSIFNQLNSNKNNLRINEEKLQNLNNKRIENEATISAIEAANVEKVDNKNSSFGEIEELERSLLEFEKIADNAEKLWNETNVALEENRAKIIKINQEIKHVDSQLQTLNSLLTKHVINQGRLAAELKVLEDAEKNYSGYASGAKLLLEENSKQVFQGNTSSISAHLNVPKKYEIAIGAVLGDFANGVIVKNQSDIDKSLEILESGLAKAALLPTKSISPDKTIEIKDFPSALAIGADVVDTSPELRPTVDLLLGQVIIVESRKIAKRIMKQIPNRSVAVTLAGELFYGSGLILVDHKGGLGVLGKVREKAELSERVKQENQKIKDINIEISKFSKQKETLSSSLSKIEIFASQIQKDENRLKLEFDALSLEADQRRNKIQLHKNQFDNIDIEYESNLQKVTAIIQSTKVIDDDIQLITNLLRDTRVKINSISLEENQAQLTHWETEFAVISRALSDSEKLEKERKFILDSASENLASLANKDFDLKNNFEKLEQETTEMRSSEGGISERIQSLQELINPEEIMLSRKEIEQVDLQEREEKGRNELSVAERRNSNAQIQLAKQEDGLSILREKIIDDFGLVDFEYEEDISGPTPLPFGDMVERLPVVKELPEELEETLSRQRLQLKRIGSVNPDAKNEYQEVKNRFEFLTEQMADLESAEIDLRNVIDELDTLMEKEFRITFENVSREFQQIFKRLFIGGSAKLLMTEGDAFHDLGVDIEAKLPGKRVQKLALLSGGERSLTAAALVFALIKSSPTPFCIMDEIDAALDEANVGRFVEVLSDLSKETQFVVITHNRNTVQMSDVIYGITMGRDSVSQSISLKLEDVDDRYSS
jgi:chromosome segregation protein